MDPKFQDHWTFLQLIMIFFIHTSSLFQLLNHPGKEPFTLFLTVTFYRSTISLFTVKPTLFIVQNEAHRKCSVTIATSNYVVEVGGSAHGRCFFWTTFAERLTLTFDL